VLAGASLAVACGEVVGANFGGLSAAGADAGDDSGGTHVESADASDASIDEGPTADASDAAVDTGEASTDAGDAATLPAGATVLYSSASAVAVGATDDVIWILGSTTQAAGTVQAANYLAYQWSPSSNTFVLSADAADYGIALGVTPSGPCFVRQDNTIWATQPGGGLTTLAGVAKFIGGGTSGSIWVLSNSQQPQENDDYKAFLWNGQFDGNPFVAEPHVYGTDVAVAADGTAWLPLATGGIVHAVFDQTTSDYEPQTVAIPGDAGDVGVGAAGVYAIGQASDGTPSLFKYSTSTNQFAKVLTLDATSIAVGTSIVVVVMADGRVVSFPAP
jgi:hypothetical protein